MSNLYDENKVEIRTLRKKITSKIADKVLKKKVVALFLHLENNLGNLFKWRRGKGADGVLMMNIVQEVLNYYDLSISSLKKNSVRGKYVIAYLLYKHVPKITFKHLEEILGIKHRNLLYCQFAKIRMTGELTVKRKNETQYMKQDVEEIEEILQEKGII